MAASCCRTTQHCAGKAVFLTSKKANFLGAKSQLSSYVCMVSVFVTFQIKLSLCVPSNGIHCFWAHMLHLCIQSHHHECWKDIGVVSAIIFPLLHSHIVWRMIFENASNDSSNCVSSNISFLTCTVSVEFLLSQMQMKCLASYFSSQTSFRWLSKASNLLTAFLCIPLERNVLRNFWKLKSLERSVWSFAKAALAVSQASGHYLSALFMLSCTCWLHLFFVHKRSHTIPIHFRYFEIYFLSPFRKKILAGKWLLLTSFQLWLRRVIRTEVSESARQLL